MKRKREFVFLRPVVRLGIGMMAALLASCSNEMMVEDLGVEEPTAPTTLRLTTRSGDGAAVSYPVSIYVMQGDVCQAVKTVTGAGETTIPLTVGTYDVYAVGGASSDDYTLPAVSDAAPSTVLSLKEGRAHGKLMTASAQTTLTPGGENSVALQLRRKVLMLQTVTIAQAPASVTAVSVTISPLSEAITIAGDYSGTDGGVSVDLECQADGTTWKKEANQYLLPSASAATVTIAITTAEGTRRYTRTLDDPFVANKKYNLSASYQAAAQLWVELSAEEWLADETIDFDFSDDDVADDNGGDDNTNPTPDPSPTGAGSVPAVGDIYQTCYVLAVSDQGDHADVTLLSPNETSIGDTYYNITSGAIDETAQTAAVSAAVDAKIAISDVDAISDWRLPTYAELNAINAASEAINAALDTDVSTGLNYLYEDNGTVRQRTLSATTNAGTATFGAIARVRPVVTVTIAKE